MYCKILLQGQQVGGCFNTDMDLEEIRLWEWEVNWTGSESCPMAGFGIHGSEPGFCYQRVSVITLICLTL
jgi:hypothetical protein